MSGLGHGFAQVPAAHQIVQRSAPSEPIVRRQKPVLDPAHSQFGDTQFASPQRKVLRSTVLSPQVLGGLQRAIGNRAVSKLVARQSAPAPSTDKRLGRSRTEAENCREAPGSKRPGRSGAFRVRFSALGLPPGIGTHRRGIRLRDRKLLCRTRGTGPI